MKKFFLSVALALAVFCLPFNASAAPTSNFEQREVLELNQVQQQVDVIIIIIEYPDGSVDIIIIIIVQP